MKNILYKESIVHIKHAFRMMKNTFWHYLSLPELLMQRILTLRI